MTRISEAARNVTKSSTQIDVSDIMDAHSTAPGRARPHLETRK